MADSGKIAGGVVVLGVLVAGLGAWFLLDRSPEPAVPPVAVPDAPAAVVAPSAAPVPPVAVPTMPADAVPASVAGRIADLQAQIRDEQAEYIASSTRIGEEVQALRREQEVLEADIQDMDEGRLARLGSRGDKQEDRCDPAEPESRACKRQEALDLELGAAQQDRAALEQRQAELAGREQALLAERTYQLRAVDDCEARLRSDPELVRLYAELARQEL
jgi:hypothetical protein